MRVCESSQACYVVGCVGGDDSVLRLPLVSLRSDNFTTSTTDAAASTAIHCYLLLLLPIYLPAAAAAATTTTNTSTTIDYSEHMSLPPEDKRGNATQRERRMALTSYSHKKTAKGKVHLI